MKHKFGWDLPPGVTDRMIEEQAGAFEEEEMPNEEEKLVEEIASHIETVAKHSDHEMELAAEGAAMAIIALTLSAVRDGRLELPGEVGRWNLTDIYEPTGKWLQSWLKEMMFKKDMHTLIALSVTSP